MWLNVRKWSEHGVLFTFWLRHMCFARQQRALFRHLNLIQKVLGDRQFLTLLTCECAQNGVHFFDIWTSKSALRPEALCAFSLRNVLRARRRALVEHRNFQKCSTCFLFSHFDFEMCSAPQPHVNFGHFNFQDCSEHGVFCACWLGNMLRATAVCTFSTSESELPKCSWCHMCFVPQRRTI